MPAQPLARLRVTLQDDGGTANGGHDSTSADFTIFLDPTPVARNLNIAAPWKQIYLPVALVALDADSYDGRGFVWLEDPFPWPVFCVRTAPSHGFLTDHVASRDPDKDGPGVIRYASKSLRFDYRLPQTGMVKAGTRAAAGQVTVQPKDQTFVMTIPAQGVYPLGAPGYDHNFVATFCWVPYSSTWVGSDTFTYDVIDPDGYVSGTVSVGIEIFEI